MTGQPRRRVWADRGWVVLAVLAAALLLGVLAGQARGADAFPAFDARSTAWIEEALGTDLPDDRPWVVAPDEYLASCGASPIRYAGGCWGLATVASIETTAALRGNLSTLAAGATPPDPVVVQLYLHESLHDGGTGLIEEGYVSAVAWHLTRPWLWAMFRVRGYPEPIPDVTAREVAVVRQASALATGKSWRSPEARRWLYSLHALGAVERERRIAAVFQ